MSGSKIYPDTERFDADAEFSDWVASLDDAIRLRGKEWGEKVLRRLRMHAQSIGVNLPLTSITPYQNSIPLSLQPNYPGDLEMERRITNLIRWNAMAMVHRSNTSDKGIGGHIATYASCAVLYEVGQNHFFRGADHPNGPDFVYFQGHASPGMYSRAFLEGRLSEDDISHFRKETRKKKGLSSYPHPWLMPNFWQFPTVSMGLSTISAIYHARFMRYLEDRGLKDPRGQKIWCFAGDGETDEPESLGAINLASREKLDNLILVINCNLQRLDGPVRGNGKIIQELEGTFRGSGWKVLKVIWGGDWDPVFAKDKDNLLVSRAEEVVDGEFQNYSVQPGWYMRKHFFGKSKGLLKLVEDIPDERLKHLSRGGHDPEKVYAAYRAAMESDGRPTVILVNTIKGFGMDESGEGLNIAHNAKVMTLDALKAFRDKFELPIADDKLEEVPFIKPNENSAEISYLLDRRRTLGGYIPERRVVPLEKALPEDSIFSDFSKGSEGMAASTTMVFVRMLSRLLKDEKVGKNIVPIVPDESRTFGLDALFRQVGIYASTGQKYTPVDRENVLYYREESNGQILEEGITEAGSMASFVAAGTAYANHQVPAIPVYMFYSMFGFQRTADQVWLSGDARARGFLMGCTAGKTTLNGEGLQHQDGHSHVFASSVPNVKAYDPAFAYEVATIFKEGMRRMLHEQEDWIYYITLQNENYIQPPMPEGSEEGIIKGLYLCKPSGLIGGEHRVRILGSASILLRALEAQKLIEEKFGIAADVYSATSYNELRRDALEAERWNMLHPESEAKVPYVTGLLGGDDPVVAVSDYMKIQPDGLAKWIPAKLVTLGSDGFGRSDTRPALRSHFEIDENYVALAALWGLAKSGKLEAGRVARAIGELDIDPEKASPLLA